MLFAIVPAAPSTDATHAIQGQPLATLRAQGESVFTQSGCGDCHYGAAKTDSAAGNSQLDLTGPVVSSLTPGGVLLSDVQIGAIDADAVVVGAVLIAHAEQTRDGCRYFGIVHPDTIDPAAVITDVRVDEKTGGKTGVWRRS